MTAVSVRRERIHLHLPVGATGAQWSRALEVARTFASAYLDKPTGPRHGTCYRYDDGEAYSVWWTPTRAVSVWWQPSVDWTPLRHQRVP